MSPDLIKTPFGFSSTAAEVIAGVDLSGKRAIVTGASSGIGVETARALAAAGAAVTLAVRNTATGEQVAADIRESTGNNAVTVAALELSDLSSVDAFAAAWSEPLDILVNNAGVMASPEPYTRHGWELQLATNHLGRFALAAGLHRALAAAEQARIVAVSSCGHQRSPVVQPRRAAFGTDDGRAHRRQCTSPWPDVRHRRGPHTHAVRRPRATGSSLRHVVQRL